jgi:CheY-like chemotaxis protein
MRRILVVEYDQSVALTLRDGLERLADCEVSVAVDGEHAVRLCEEQPFDVLVTDYKMPGTDGLALARRIRDRNPQTRVVMLTAYRDDRLWQQVAARLVWAVLDRPVGLGEIRCAVSEALGRMESLPCNGGPRRARPIARKGLGAVVRQQGGTHRGPGADPGASNHSTRGMGAVCPGGM